jgi:PhnB protein
VEDCDAAYKRAMEAGATSIMEPADQFYGDRSAGVNDQFGNRWWIATHEEDLSR